MLFVVFCCIKFVCCVKLFVVLNPYYRQIQELFYTKFCKTLFSPFLLRTYYYGFHTRELKHAVWNIWHAWICSKYSISPLSSKNDLIKGTFQTVYLFSKYNKKGAFQSSLHFFLLLRESVRVRSYSGPYFPGFRLNMERYRVSLRIQSK